MSEVICCFNVQLHNGDQRAWTVPISLENIPTKDNIEIFEQEVRNQTFEHSVLDCYFICDKDMNILFSDGTVQKQDIVAAFDVMSESELFDG